MNTIIVDDASSIRENLGYYLQEELKINVLASFSNGTDLLEYPDSHEADIILMDICMHGIDGFETSKALLWKYPYLKIIAITMYQDIAYLDALLGAGFKGCVFKSQIYKDLPSAIKTVVNGGLYFPNDVLIK